MHQIFFLISSPITYKDTGILVIFNWYALRRHNRYALMTKKSSDIKIWNIPLYIWSSSIVYTSYQHACICIYRYTVAKFNIFCNKIPSSWVGFWIFFIRYYHMVLIVCLETLESRCSKIYEKSVIAQSLNSATNRTNLNFSKTKPEKNIPTSVPRNFPQLYQNNIIYVPEPVQESPPQES